MHISASPFRNALRTLALAALAALAALGAVSARLSAQTGAVTVQGTVTAGGTGIAGVTVKVTPEPGGRPKSVVTDSAGRFATRFPGPAPRYRVEVAASEWQPFRTTVGAPPVNPVITVDVALVRRRPVVLDGLTVRGRRRRAPPGPEFGIETGGAEVFAEGVVGAVGPDAEGEIGAIAATTPGVLATAGGPSLLGLGAGQTSTTLNGMVFTGAELPRDAKTRTRVSSSAYDPSRGGFGGGQVAVELTPGGPFTFRRARLTLDAPPLQFQDAASGRLTGSLLNLHASAGGDGELVENRYYYNAAVQASRRTADAASLVDADDAVLRLAGVHSDSARRAIELLERAGVPLRAARSGSRAAETVSFIGRLDRAPLADRTWNVTAYGRLARADAIDLSPLRTPASAARSSTVDAALQGTYAWYFGNNVLNEARTALNLRRTALEAYRHMPGGNVLVATPPGEDAAGLAALWFGGSALGDARTEWTWESVSETKWYDRGGRHRFKLYAQSRLDGYSRRGSANSLGTFTYPSLAALAENHPSSYSRTSTPSAASGAAWSGALALGDLWARSPRFQVQYGVRLEANRFLSPPAFNPAVLERFGSRTDAVPNRVHLSPRLGFTWVYSRRRQESPTNASSALGYRFVGPSGVLRGGIGEFRQLLDPSLPLEAAMATGLPGASQRVLCLGPAVPTPDWAAFADGSAAAPDACAGGGGPPAFADAAPSVRLFDRRYTAPRSWRGNLSWTSRWRGIGFMAEGVYSLNLNQPGTVDVNFRDRPVFTLAEEGNRPVFVDPSSIVPGTGSVSPTDARVSGAFGRVVSNRSDLRSESGHLTLRLSPDLPIRQYYLSLAYTLAHSRAQARGFDGAAFASPTARDWAPGDLDVRHRFLLQAGWANRKLSVTMSGTLASGLPFTPLVGGDINGDGLANDRAFVFDPALTADPALAGDLRALRLSAPSWARRCLDAHAGHAAGRNGCRGPWTQSLDARVELSSVLLRTRRVSAALTFVNLVGGLDRLLHGSGGLHGWGTASLPDPVLYEVQGFDPAARRFLYQVNPSFGETRPATRAPFRVTIEASVNLAPPLDAQQLRRSLRARPAPQARSAGTHAAVDSIRTLYRNSVADVYAVILQERDSLLLTAQQIAALEAARTPYRRQVDAIWTELAVYLAALPAGHDPAEALRRQEEATDRVWEVSRAEARSIHTMLSPLQQRMLPELIHTLIHTNEKIRFHSVGP